MVRIMVQVRVVVRASLYQSGDGGSDEEGTRGMHAEESA